jgi:hypothetical protein
MIKKALLQPDLILGDTVTKITPALLRQYQLQGLILDVDETLVPLKKREVSELLQEWIAEIRQVALIWLVSNNLSQSRISGIARSLNLPYLASAKKPSRRKLRQAVAEMDLPIERVAMVGDRIFTDVLAGNRLGMFTILVEPMLDPAVVARAYPIRNFEVWLSKIIGVSLATTQHKFTGEDES